MPPTARARGRLAIYIFICVMQILNNHTRRSERENDKLRDFILGQSFNEREIELVVE